MPIHIKGAASGGGSALIPKVPRVAADVSGTTLKLTGVSFKDALFTGSYTDLSYFKDRLASLTLCKLDKPSVSYEVFSIQVCFNLNKVIKQASNDAAATVVDTPYVVIVCYQTIIGQMSYAYLNSSECPVTVDYDNNSISIGSISLAPNVGVLSGSWYASGMAYVYE